MTRLRRSVFGLVAAALTFAVVPFAGAQNAALLGSHTARPLITQPVDDSNLVALKAPEPNQIKASKDAGPAAANAVVNFSLELTRAPEQQQALATVRAAHAKAKGRNAGITLTPEEFAETFGIAESDMKAVATWLEGKNLNIASVSLDGSEIRVAGTAANIEAAFHTEIHNVVMPDGSHALRAQGPWQMPAVFEPIVANVQDFDVLTIRQPVDAASGLIVRPSRSGEVVEARPGLLADYQIDPYISSHYDGPGGPVTMARNGLATHHPDLNGTTLTLTSGTASVAYGIGTTSTLTAVLTWTIAGTPTGSITISDSYPTVSVTIPLTSCTLTTATKYTCTYTWTTPTGAGTSPDTLTAVYSGDANYGTATSAAASEAISYTGSDELFAASLTPNPTTGNSGTAVTITGYVDGDRYNATGTQFFWGSGGIQAIKAVVNATPACTRSDNSCNGDCAYSCAVAWTVPAGLPTGTYTLYDSYSGAANAEDSTQITATFTVTAGTTANTTAISANPNSVSSSVTGSVFTVTLTYTGTNPATGTIALTETTDARALGTIVLPTSGLTSSSGTSTPYTGTSSYSCSTNTGTKVITCTVTDSDVFDTLPVVGANTVKAAYGGDSTYAASSGTTTVTEGIKFTTTTAVTLNPATVAYGSGTAVSVAATVTFSNATDVANGIVTLSDANGALPTQTISISTCTALTSTSYKCTYNWTNASGQQSFTTPDVVTATYASDTNYSGSSGTANLTITFASGGNSYYAATYTLSPATQTYGVSTQQTINFTVTGAKNVAAPTGTAILSGQGAVGYIGTINLSTCTQTTSSGRIKETCPAFTWNPSATIPVGSYAMYIELSGDSNYSPTYFTANPVYDFVVSKGTATLALTPSPLVSPYGSTTGVTLTATVSGLGTTPSGTVNFSGPYTTYGSLSATSCTFSAATSCSVTFTPNGTTAASATPYSPFITATTASNTNYATATATDTLQITQLTTSLALVAATPGSTTTGVTSTTLTATLSPAISGVTVTFTDAATGATQTAATNSSGVASVSATGTVAGLNKYTASIAGTTNYTAATSNTVAVYYAGILFSTTGLHDFSGLITYQGQQVEGTVDGTKLGPYGVTVYNFTSSAQALTYTAPSSDQAFSYTTTCGASLASGASCAYEFYYAPPYGDGCTVGSNCTTDSQGYPQGTYESANWNVAAPNGVLTGIGDKQFDRYGAVTLPGTLAGKAILAQGSLSVSPTTYSFGNWASGVTSNTLTVVVSNSSAAPVAFTFTGPSTSEFTVTNNTCATPLGANASCNIYVTFEGANPSTYTDSLTIQPSGSAAIMVSLSGTVQTNSGLTITSNNHNFGNVTDGTTATFAFGVTNNSGTAQPVTLTYTAAAGYTVSNSCPASLAAAATCGITVQFAPTTAGAVTQSLTIGSNTFILPGGTSSSPYTDTVTVSGTGVAGGQFTATSVAHNFGAVTVGVSAGNYGVELSNNTSSTVTFSLGQGFTNGANGFSLVGSSCNSGSLAPNANCELIFSFDPTATGFVSAAYGITSSVSLYSGGAVVSPEQITLSGTGQ